MVIRFMRRTIASRGWEPAKYLPLALLTCFPNFTKRAEGHLHSDGAYGVVLITDEPSEEAITTCAMGVGSLGYIRTQTMRASSADEVNKILAKSP